jgi:hypothetical protein
VSNQKRDYDSTIARIAGNVVPGLMAQALYDVRSDDGRELLAASAVFIARAIVAEVKRTESPQVQP